MTDELSPASPQRVPPRLHVIFAREADLAVVIRRGPSRRTAVIGWNRADDSFSLGQWVSARIYERRSDLSPDGRHFIYFALDGRWSSPARGAWTAISRAPWLKAEALFDKGDGWHGGGLFLDRRRYWLNDGAGHGVLHDHTGLARGKAGFEEGLHGAECEGVYFHRLRRDGWRLTEHRPGTQRGHVTVFERALPSGWTLRKYAFAGGARAIGRGVYRDTHALVPPRLGAEQAKPAWEWADLDGRRLVWAEGGRLHAAAMGPGGLIAPRILHDFSGMRSENRAAPY